MRWKRGQHRLGLIAEQYIGWRLLRPPHDDVAMAVSMPIGATLCSAVIIGWLLLPPSVVAGVGYATLLVAFAVVAPVHELVHMAAFRADRRSLAFESTSASSSLRAGYDGVVSRGHRRCWS